MGKKHIKKLKAGKQIRIKYNTKIYDGCEEPGWWEEELWSYDSNLNLFKCHYPVSSYEKDFFTTHTKYDTKTLLKEASLDLLNENDKMVEGIFVEDNNLIVTIRNKVIDKFVSTLKQDDFQKFIFEILLYEKSTDKCIKSFCNFIDEFAEYFKSEAF